MTKEQVKEIIKEMIKNEEIKIYVNNQSDNFNEVLTTEIQVWVDGDCVQEHKDTVYLSD